METGKTTLRRRLNAKTQLGEKRVDRVIDEYRRFLYLAAMGPVAVPSKLVDFVWHMHLEDTRAYDLFCKSVIGKFIHHAPGRPSQGDDPDYPKTLKAYAAAFGEEPFWRIWPLETRPFAKAVSTTGVLVTGGSVLASFASGNTYLLFGIVPGLILLAIGRAMAPWSAMSMFGGSDGSGCGGGDAGCGGDGGCGGD
ncbi:MAG: hypothetical protein ABI459_05855 [Deltaproteobacteria bacterium]